MTINMGSHHPSKHGVLRLIVTLDGEDVIDCEPMIGYLHRGVEKNAENPPLCMFLTSAVGTMLRACLKKDVLLESEGKLLGDLNPPPIADYQIIDVVVDLNPFGKKKEGRSLLSYSFIKMCFL